MDFFEICQISVRNGAHKLFHRLLNFSQFLTAILSWIQSFITFRAQAVRVGDDESAISRVLCGVPQGESNFGCVLAYHCVHGTAPAYLADSLRPTSEFVGGRHLRSADTTMLLVPPTRRVTLGDRAFSVAAARAWNSLPAQIRAASSLLSFRRQTKAHLFQLSYN